MIKSTRAVNSNKVVKLTTASNKKNLIGGERYIVDRADNFKVTIDKLSLTAHIPIEEQNNVISSMNTLAMESNGRLEYLTKSGKDEILVRSSTFGSSYHHTYFLTPVRGGNRLKERIVLQVKPKSFRKRASFMRLEWNPDRFPLEHYKDQLDALLTVGCGLTFEEILSLGKVTRIDFAIDVPNLDVNEIIADMGKKSLVITYSKKGITETCYIGLKNNGLTLYQKDKQDSSYPDRTARFEVVVKPNKSVRGLHRITNPFSSIKVYKPDLESLSYNEQYDMQLMMNTARIMGIRNFLKMPPSPHMKKHTKRIEKAVHQLFPEYFWARYLGYALEEYGLYMPPITPKVKKKYMPPALQLTAKYVLRS